MKISKKKFYSNITRIREQTYHQSFFKKEINFFDVIWFGRVLVRDFYQENFEIHEILQKKMHKGLQNTVI